MGMERRVGSIGFTWGQLRVPEEEPLGKAKPFRISKRVVWEAFQWVRANKGAAGVDGESIESLRGTSRRTSISSGIGCLRGVIFRRR